MTAMAPAKGDEEVVPGQSPAWFKRIFTSPSSAAGSILLLGLLGAWVVGSLLVPYGPTEVGAGPSLGAPSTPHWMGTDQLGRDQLARLLSAVPVGFVVPAIAVSLALLVGTAIGVAAGYSGKVVDRTLMIVTDVVLAMPAILMALVIVGALGGGVWNTSLAISFIYMPRFVRVARASVMGVKSRPFVESARVSAIGRLAIVRRHVLPNILPPLIVMSALSLSTATLANASLSFLGLGVVPPTADFGNMLALGIDYMSVAPWLVIGPSLGLVILVLGFNLLGDGVRDVLDPRMASNEPRV